MERPKSGSSTVRPLRAVTAIDHHRQGQRQVEPSTARRKSPGAKVLFLGPSNLFFAPSNTVKYANAANPTPSFAPQLRVDHSRLSAVRVQWNQPRWYLDVKTLFTMTIV
jgi:hypothetical protein